MINYYFPTRTQIAMRSSCKLEWASKQLAEEAQTLEEAQQAREYTINMKNVSRTDCLIYSLKRHPFQNKQQKHDIFLCFICFMIFIKEPRSVDKSKKSYIDSFPLKRYLSSLKLQILIHLRLAGSMFDVFLFRLIILDLVNYVPSNIVFSFLCVHVLFDEVKVLRFLAINKVLFFLLFDSVLEVLISLLGKIR